METEDFEHNTKKVKYRRISIICLLAAVILSDVMCAAIAYQYCDIMWKTKYFLTSAPADMAFILIIPFALGIIFFGILSLIYYRKSKRV